MEAILLDSDLKKELVIDAFDSFLWIDRYAKYGDFEILMRPNRNIKNHRGEDRYLVIAESEHVMILEASNTKRTVDDGAVMLLSGRSLETILYRRIVWNQTILDGNLQDCIEQLLNENAINPTILERKINRLVFEASEDPVVTGLTLKGQYKGEFLYDVISKICLASDIGFKISLDENDNFVFQLYAGKDRSYAQFLNPYVVFSPKYDNLINSEYKDNKMNLCNVALVGGEGEGSDQFTAVAYGDNIPGLDFQYEDLSRRELYVDGGGISKTTDGGTLTDEEYTDQLRQKGWEELELNNFEKSFEGEVNADNDIFKFEEDFFMGDLVQIDDDNGNESQVRVVEIIYSHDGSGTKIYPTFSTII